MWEVTFQACCQRMRCRRVWLWVALWGLSWASSLWLDGEDWDEQHRMSDATVKSVGVWLVQSELN